MQRKRPTVGNGGEWASFPPAGPSRIRNLLRCCFVCFERSPETVEESSTMDILRKLDELTNLIHSEIMQAKGSGKVGPAPRPPPPRTPCTDLFMSVVEVAYVNRICILTDSSMA